jgi:pimeloyl-ACP methyl ester carboxylesterase
MSVPFRTSVLAMLLPVMVSCAYTPKIRNSAGKVNPMSITEEFSLTIGGIKQWMMIRGANRSNPILLYIHGGPGKCEMPLQRIYNSELENHFVVVTWDQRGAGKTNRIIGDVKDFTLDAYLNDTYEVIQYLKKRFGREKMFLVGHSWGALLGILTVRDHPDDFYAYVGIGQVTGLQQNIGEAYRQALSLATKKGNKKIIRKLSRMKLDEGNLSDVPLRNIIYIREYINRNTPHLIRKKIYPTLVWKSIWSPEYSIPDVIRAIIGISGSINFLQQNDLSAIDMYKMVPELKVPFFIISGTQDLFTNPDLTRAYLEFVQAPYKKFILFERSTHHPNYEEAERYNHILIEEVKPIGLAYGGKQKDDR